MKILASTHNYKYIFFYIILLLLFPLPSFINDTLTMKLLLLFILAFTVRAIYKKNINKKLLFPIVLQYSFFFISLAFNMTSITGYYDFTTELFRYIIYFVIINGILFYLKDLPNHKIMSYSQRIIIFVLGIQLFADILYISPAHEIIDAWFGQAKLNRKIRLTGTMENPNYVAFLVCSVLGLLFAIRPSLNKYAYYIFLFISIILVFLSGSRTGIIVIFLLMLLREIKITLPAIILGSGIIYNILSSSPRYEILVNAGSLQDMLSLASFSGRYDIVIEALKMIAANPLTGLLETPIEITDNYFIMYLLRYGIIAFICMLLCVIIYISKSVKNNIERIMSLVPFLITFVIFGLTGSFFDNFRLFFFFSFFVILSIKYLNQVKVIS